MPADWTTDFLAALALTPSVAAACREAGISRQAAYERRKSDPEFARAWQDALDEGTDELVAEMYRRAVHGVERRVLHRGEPVTDEQGRPVVEVHYSDALAIFLAKTHRPEVYGDRLRLDAEVKTRDGDGLRSELAAIVAALRQRGGIAEDPPDLRAQLPGRTGGGGDLGPPDDASAP